MNYQKEKEREKDFSTASETVSQETKAQNNVKKTILSMPLRGQPFYIADRVND